MDATGKRPRLGVLGGMGPLATAVFYNRLVDEAKLTARKDQDHPDVLIWSDCSLPDRTEVILHGDDGSLLKQCERDFALLKQAGCDYICFPCNTLHYFMPQLEQLTDLPILNMVELALQSVRKLHPSAEKLQIFATEGTRQGKLYERYAKRYGFEIVPVPDPLQQEIMGFIYDLKNSGCVDFPLLSQRIIEAREQGVDYVILACTELSCMTLNAKAACLVYDAMDALISRCLELVMPGQNKLENKGRNSL